MFVFILAYTKIKYKQNTNKHNLIGREVYNKKEYKVDHIDQIPDIIEEIKETENVSVPLYMCLVCLKRYYENYKEDLKEFLFLN